MKKLFTSTLLVILFLSFAVVPSKALDSIKQKYVNYNGVQVYTEAYNYSPEAKEAIIFLHGLGGSHSHGEFLYDQSNKYMTITMDFLDHGNSGHVSSMNWDTQVDSIKAVLDAYGLKKAHLVGHSLGADTAMMFAKKYPKNVKDIVLLDRAYYNYEDLDQFKITKDLMSTLEYSPASGLSYDEFLQYINMAWYNDITKTWDIDKDVLLLAADTKNYTGDPENGVPSLAGIISMVKQYPEAFGIDPEIAKNFPDITEDNITDVVNYLKEKVSEFDEAKAGFSVIQTSYTHGDMVRDSEAMNAMRNYVLDYLQGE